MFFVATRHGSCRRAQGSNADLVLICSELHFTKASSQGAPFMTANTSGLKSRKVVHLQGPGEHLDAGTHKSSKARGTKVWPVWYMVQLRL